MVIESTLTSQQSTRQLYLGNVVFAVTQAASLVLLVPALGVLGAVISRLLARFCLFGFYSYSLWSLSGTARRE
jgi:hypothetical protein